MADPDAFQEHVCIIGGREINHICRPMRAQILLPDCVLPVSKPKVEAAAEGGYIDKAPILPTKFYT